MVEMEKQKFSLRLLCLGGGETGRFESEEPEDGLFCGVSVAPFLLSARLTTAFQLSGSRYLFQFFFNSRHGNAG